VTEAVVADAGASEPGREPLFRRLVWLTLFRLVLVTVLLGGTAVVGWRQARDPDQVATPIYGLILATYAGSLVVALLLRSSRRLSQGAVAHVVFDVLLAGGLVALTGRSESVFLFMFLLAIVNGAILLGRPGAALGLLLSLAVYAVTLWDGGRLRAVPGTTLWAHAAAFVATAALAAYLAEQLRSTGERLAARETDLADVTALHGAIVQSVASGLLTVDPQGRITFLNRAGEQITDLAADEVVGRPAVETLPGFAEDGGRGETEWTNPRGERLTVGFSRFPLLGQGGRALGSAVIFQDLTGLRAMEERVRRSERFADLGRVAAGLAHELRNPLASMAGSVELLSGSEGLRREDQRLMAIVLKEAARLEQLVSRFLDYSRPVPPRLVPHDLAQVVAEVAEVFAGDPSAVRARVERALTPVTVPCDPDQLRQVLWNLLVNAAQAIQGGGVGGTIRLRCGPDGQGGALVEVEDDGPGISAADRPRLFTPFFTTKSGGTGLGLATVHRIVEAHGGALEVAAVEPHGVRFTVHLGATPPTPTPALATAG
jgi:two-component system sensor histidine kinase PilS (NtrC family)